MASQDRVIAAWDDAVNEKIVDLVRTEEVRLVSDSFLTYFKLVEEIVLKNLKQRLVCTPAVQMLFVSSMPKALMVSVKLVSSFQKSLPFLTPLNIVPPE